MPPARRQIPSPSDGIMEVAPVRLRVAASAAGVAELEPRTSNTLHPPSHVTHPRSHVAVPGAGRARRVHHRLRLETTPRSTGSAPTTKTIGMVAVAALAPTAAGGAGRNDRGHRVGHKLGGQCGQSIEATTG